MPHPALGHHHLGHGRDGPRCAHLHDRPAPRLVALDARHQASPRFLHLVHLLRHDGYLLPSSVLDEGELLCKVLAGFERHATFQHSICAWCYGLVRAHHFLQSAIHHTSRHLSNSLIQRTATEILSTHTPTSTSPRSLLAAARTACSSAQMSRVRWCRSSAGRCSPSWISASSTRSPPWPRLMPRPPPRSRSTWPTTRAPCHSSMRRALPASRPPPRVRSSFSLLAATSRKVHRALPTKRSGAHPTKTTTASPTPSNHQAPRERPGMNHWQAIWGACVRGVTHTHLPHFAGRSSLPKRRD
mmetsp:Transcript_83771/g.236625  ORF Transcript_83771/g.236625 Transcript_83771/m.236625 type:complete len:300 (-) Transcript_83771:70-969(-)